MLGKFILNPCKIFLIIINKITKKKSPVRFVGNWLLSKVLQEGRETTTKTSLLLIGNEYLLFTQCVGLVPIIIGNP